MPLTRGFKDAIAARAKNDPEFRAGLRVEAAECLINNELDVAESLLRDHVIT